MQVTQTYFYDFGSTPRRFAFALVICSCTLVSVALNQIVWGFIMTLWCAERLLACWPDPSHSFLHMWGWTQTLHLATVASKFEQFFSVTTQAPADEYLRSQKQRQADDLRTDVFQKQGQKNSSGEKSYSHNLILKNLGCNNYGNPGSNIWPCEQTSFSLWQLKAEICRPRKGSFCAVRLSLSDYLTTIIVQGSGLWMDLQCLCPWHNFSV